MRSGCWIDLLRSLTGRQLDSLAALAIAARLSPALTTYLLRPRWSLAATATIRVLPRSTAGLTASALAGSANADTRTAAPRPTAALRRAVRPKWCPLARAWERAKERTSWSTGLGLGPPGAGRAVRRHATYGCARYGRWPGGRVVGARTPPASTSGAG